MTIDSAVGTGTVTTGTLWDLLSDRARTSRERTMLIDEHGRRETFGSVVDAVERVAAGLLAQGISAGSTVSWQLPTRIDTVVLSMALARLGAVQNPIIPIYRGREVGAMVDQCASEWLITLERFRGFDHRAMAEEVRENARGPLELMVITDGLPDGDPATLPAPPTDGDAARWIYTTSGTTSAPKGVCHSDGTLMAGGLGLADALGATAEDVSTILFPYAHIGGPDMMVAGLVTGMALVIMEVFEPVAAVELMRGNSVTVTGGSTPHYSLLLAEQRKQPGTALIPTLRALAGGGAPMPESLFRDVLHEMGIPVLHAYGMTECPMITAARPADATELLATTSGRPVLGCEVQIRSEDDEVLPVGVAGRVWLRGSMLFKHYLDDGDIVRPFDEDGWLFTGDLGRLQVDGHLVLVGREKDLIIRKGESISPIEIEVVLSQHPAIADVAVIGLADDVRGERICAVVQLHPDALPLELSDLREHCHESGISPAKYPEQIEFVSEMPRTPTMKIRKQNLRASLAGSSAAEKPRPAAVV
ncbi:class I adenylate-forming enzyme family protein [Rhodococcus sovatensis]|uniref:AMP-binding protein n=1 Tax=Rhodococcus sovatensis TaxID=1805840 RepID=A0ABZ2PKD0_9NOCA